MIGIKAKMKMDVKIMIRHEYDGKKPWANNCVKTADHIIQKNLVINSVGSINNSVYAIRC